MPWIWTDDLARCLLTSGQLDSETALRITSSPVAIRIEASSEPDHSEPEDEDDLSIAA